MRRQSPEGSLPVLPMLTPILLQGRPASAPAPPTRRLLLEVFELLETGREAMGSSNADSIASRILQGHRDQIAALGAERLHHIPAGRKLGTHQVIKDDAKTLGCSEAEFRDTCIAQAHHDYHLLLLRSCRGAVLQLSLMLHAAH